MASMDIRIQLFSDSWVKRGKIYARGFAFMQEDFLDAEKIAQTFDKAIALDQIMETLSNLNGYFSIIIESPTYLLIAVDRVRSFPVFYAKQKSTVYVTDQPYWIVNAGEMTHLDKCSAAEFLLTGYVTGSYTLVQGIRQVRAGELICLNLQSEHISNYRWYKFMPEEESGHYSSVAELMERLDNVTDAAISRLIRFADGRPIVVPLSGGLDSRLIAMCLRLARYEPVYTFSYGVPGNTESEASRAVAKQLGFPWKFVPYSRNRWYSWYRSNEWQAYARFAEALVSVPHIQDWPAVWELLVRKEIPETSVFVPGHTGDFISGGHIPLEIIRFSKKKISDVINSVQHHHYRIFSLTKVAEKVCLPPSALERCIIKERIKNVLRDITVSSTEQAVNACQYWEWQERQAKFIVNSVRVYEFWKRAWWLPWWDAEFMEFWKTVPLKLRLNQALYIQYVRMLQQKLGIAAPVPRKSDGMLIERLKGIAWIFPLTHPLLQFRRSLISVRRKRAKIKEYYTHPMGWYGISNEQEFKEVIANLGNINTILAIHRLEALGKEIGNTTSEGVNTW